MSEERLKDLVKMWDKQRPTMCTIDEDDIESIKFLLQRNKGLENIKNKLSNALDSAKQRIDKAMAYSHKRLGFLENCVGGNDKQINQEISIHQKYLSVLQGKEMK